MKFKWTIEIEVDPIWVADGFDLNEENVQDRVWKMLPYALGHEFKAKVLKAPPKKLIEETQF